MPPAKQLLRMELPPPGHIRYPHARTQCLRYDLRLLRRRPRSPTARSGQQLNPPETTLRVVRNVVHKDKEALPSNPPSIFMPDMEERRRNTAYGVSAPDKRQHLGPEWLGARRERTRADERERVFPQRMPAGH
jgi:hypothetical protein